MNSLKLCEIGAIFFLGWCSGCWADAPKVAGINSETVSTSPQASVQGKQANLLFTQRSSSVTVKELSTSNENPNLGETVTVQATINNTSDDDVDQVRVQFYQGDRRLGEPILIENLKAHHEVQTELRFRARSLGNYEISAVATVVDDLTGSPVHSAQTRIGIERIPVWWHHFNEELRSVAVMDGQSNSGSMRGLEKHPWCQHDILADVVIPKHGQALLDGVLMWEENEVRARERYADAVNELSKFARTLYCVDVEGLQYWDRAIARF